MADFAGSPRTLRRHVGRLVFGKTWGKTRAEWTPPAGGYRRKSTGALLGGVAVEFDRRGAIVGALGLRRVIPHRPPGAEFETDDHESPGRGAGVPVKSELLPARAFCRLPLGARVPLKS